MKKLLVIGSLLIFSTDAFAGSAVGYSCIGKNRADKESIVFSVLFSDSAPEAGYTNQSITITSKGGIELEKAIVLQMSGATRKNHCTTNELGETYMKGGFDMTPTPESNPAADYKVKFKSNCGADQKYDVNAYCVFQL